MMHMGKHGSYEDAPDLPYFKVRSKGSSSSKESSIPAEKEPVLLSPAAMVTGVSPSKRILMRSQLLEQLDKGHSLLEKGGISKEQFTSLQQATLGDIFNNTFKD